MSRLHFSALLLGALGGMLFLGRAPAAAAGCPHALLLESTNGHDYVAVFDAKSPMRASFRVEAYAQNAAYAFTANDVAVDKGTQLPRYPFRSTGLLFSNPGVEPFLAALVRPTLVDGTTCPDEHVQIPSVASAKSSAWQKTNEFVDMQQQVRREVAAAPTMIVPAALPTPQFACRQPFVAAGALKLARPNIPTVAREAGAVGTVNVMVSLDEAGALTNATVYRSSDNSALDAAAVDAARRTTYKPEVFACKPASGDYLFSVEYARS